MSNPLRVAACAFAAVPGTSQARLKPPQMACVQRQIQDVNELRSESSLGQVFCTADLITYGCDANVYSPHAFPTTGQTTWYAASNNSALGVSV